MGGRFETKQNKTKQELKLSKNLSSVCIQPAPQKLTFLSIFQRGEGNQKREGKNEQCGNCTNNSEHLWRCLAKNTAQQPCAPAALPALPAPCPASTSTGSLPLESLVPFPPLCLAPPATLGRFRVGVKLQRLQGRAHGELLPACS